MQTNVYYYIELFYTHTHRVQVKKNRVPTSSKVHTKFIFEEVALNKCVCQAHFACLLDSCWPDRIVIEVLFWYRQIKRETDTSM